MKRCKIFMSTGSLLFMLVTGCRGAPAANASSTSKAAPPVSCPGSTPSTGPAQVELDKIDSRVPVPLVPMMANHQKQNMRDHLLAVQEIVSALSKKDLPGVEKAAKRIGFSEQMGMMCNRMGMGAPGFTDQALKFHHSADDIAAAAHKGSREAVLTALGVTLQNCTGCHAAYKQNIVDETTWAQLTAQPSMPDHMR